MSPISLNVYSNVMLLEVFHEAYVVSLLYRSMPWSLDLIQIDYFFCWDLSKTNHAHIPNTIHDLEMRREGQFANDKQLRVNQAFAIEHKINSSSMEYS